MTVRETAITQMTVEVQLQQVLIRPPLIYTFTCATILICFNMIHLSTRIILWFVRIARLSYR